MEPPVLSQSLGLKTDNRHCKMFCVAKRLQWPRKLTNYGLRVTCNNDYFLVMFSPLILLLRQPHLLRNDMHGT